MIISETHSARDLLAQKLRLLRFARGWTQETLASVSGLHRTYISQIERRQCNISLDNLEKLADAFEVSVAELLSIGLPSGIPTGHYCGETAATYDFPDFSEEPPYPGLAAAHCLQ